MTAKRWAYEDAFGLGQYLEYHSQLTNRYGLVSELNDAGLIFLS